MAKQPSTVRLSLPVLPMAAAGTPCASASWPKAVSLPGRTATTARAADSLNKAVNGSSGSRTVHPVPPRRQDSASAPARPPPDRAGPAGRSPAAGDAAPAGGKGGRGDQRPARGRGGEQSGQPPFGVQVGSWRAAAQVTVAHVG